MIMRPARVLMRPAPVDLLTSSAVFVFCLFDGEGQSRSVIVICSRIVFFPRDMFIMSKNAVICAIEHCLRDDGCNEITVAELFARVTTTRGNFQVSYDDFLLILKELESDDLFEFFGESEELIARSQMHPSVPYGNAIPL
jgi:hypothetical protein